MASQLPLFADGWSVASRGFVEALRDIVTFRGLKQVAYDLGTSASFLSQCLSGRHNSHLRAEWVPWLIYHAPDDTALAVLADLRGKDVIDRSPPNPEEELAAMKSALDECLGKQLRDAIYATAKQRRYSK